MRILIADDQALPREALRSILESHGHTVVAEAGSGGEAIRLAREHHPDLVVMDSDMPGVGGLEATHGLTSAVPGTSVVVVTDREDGAELFDAIRAGANGYVSRDLHTDRFLELLEAAGRGEPALGPHAATRLLVEFARVSERNRKRRRPDDLTDREHEVLTMMAHGVTSNRELAQEFGVSENTVRFHIRHILEKLHLHNRAAAVAYALTHGMVDGKNGAGAARSGGRSGVQSHGKETPEPAA